MPFNREAWLNSAIDLMAPDFKAAGLKLPRKKIHISVGPTQARYYHTATGNIGVTWHEAGEKGVLHIFISPVLTDSIEVLATICHELIHCCFPPDTNHKKPFAEACKKLGLTPPWYATDVSPELEQRYVDMFLPVLGEYQQPMFDTSTSPQPGSRLLKASCPECGYIIRLTKKWAEQGLPACPLCDSIQLQLEVKPEAV